MLPKSYRHNAVPNRFSSRFSTSRTNGPHSLSLPKAGTHSAFGEGSHTAAYTPKQGPSLPRPQCGFVPPAKYLIFRHAFIYIHFPVLCEPSPSAKGENPAKLPPRLYLKPFFNFPHKWPSFAFTGESGYTLGFRRKIAHKGLHGETGAFRTGPLSLPSDCFTRFGNPAWPGGRTANFAAFGSRSRVLPKNTESLRDSDALMCIAAPRRRGPAGLRDPVAIVSMIKNMINPWAGSFLTFCWANANSIKKVVLQPF